MPLRKIAVVLLCCLSLALILIANAQLRRENAELRARAEFSEDPQTYCQSRADDERCADAGPVLQLQPVDIYREPERPIHACAPGAATTAITPEIKSQFPIQTRVWLKWQTNAVVMQKSTVIASGDLTKKLSCSPRGADGLTRTCGMNNVDQPMGSEAFVVVGYDQTFDEVLLLQYQPDPRFPRHTSCEAFDIVDMDPRKHELVRLP